MSTKLYALEKSTIEGISSTTENRTFSRTEKLKSLLMKPAPNLSPSVDKSLIDGEDCNINNLKSCTSVENDLAALKKLLLKPKNICTEVSEKLPHSHREEIADALKKMLLESNGSLSSTPISPTMCQTSDKSDVAALKQLLLCKPTEKSAKPIDEASKTSSVDILGTDNDRPQAKKVKKNSPLRRQSPVSSLVTGRSPHIACNIYQQPNTPKHRDHTISQSSDFCDAEKDTSFYAGSSFMNSPSPEAIPLPDFEETRQFEIVSNDIEVTPIGQASCKTQSLRRLLKL